MAKLSLTPTFRVINGRVIRFYSPAQIEHIIPPQYRLARQRKDFAVGGTAKIHSHQHKGARGMQ